MHLVNANLFLLLSDFDLYISVSCDWKIQLRDLIVLWVIRIEIVLTVEFAYLRDLTVRCKTDGSSVFYYLFILFMSISSDL